MKKLTRLLSLILAVLMLTPLVSCKKDKEEGGGDGYVWNPYPYEDLGEFISLPDYKSFTIGQPFIDEQINIILASLYDDQTLYIDVTDGRAAAKWDRVKLEYSSIVVGGETVFPVPNEGEQEGDGDTDTDENSTTFVIGVGVAYPDIEQAVIGMTLNSEKTLTFTFPDDYTANPEHAGKEATFVFKLTMHQQPPVLTDALVSTYTDYINVDILRNTFEQEIIYAELWDYLLENTVLIKRPEKEFNDYYNSFVDVFKTYAKSNNKTLEEYVTTEGQNFPSMGLYAGITMDEFYRIANEYADDNLKNDLILYQLVRLEDLKTSGGLYDAAQRELLFSYGVGYTIESLIEQHGKDQIVTSIMDIQVRKRIITYVTKTP